MNFKITLLPGDGIGPEVVGEAVRVLETIASKYKHSFSFQERLMGGCSIDKYGSSLTDETLADCQASDSVLLGAVGGPKWDDPKAKDRPERGLLVAHFDIPPSEEVEQLAVLPQFVQLQRNPAARWFDALLDAVEADEDVARAHVAVHHVGRRAVVAGGTAVVVALLAVVAFYVIGDAACGNDTSTPGYRPPRVLTWLLWGALPLLTVIVLLGVWGASPGDPLGIG